MTEYNKALKHAKGNLLDLAENGNFDVIMHGCNCFNTMGGGIAREIRERYPKAAYVDLQTIKGDYNKLGNFTKCEVFRKNNTFTILNCYTQYEMSKSEDVFEYVAFDLVLQKIIHQYGKFSIGLPYIGMGLAGGNKDIIMNQIRHFAEEVNNIGGSITLVEFA